MKLDHSVFTTKQYEIHRTTYVDLITFLVTKGDKAQAFQYMMEQVNTLRAFGWKLLSVSADTAVLEQNTDGTRGAMDV